MKQLKFRFKLIALLLVCLIGLAAVYGARTISLSDRPDALRNAILRLTGQETVSPSPLPASAETEITESPYSVEGLGSVITPDLTLGPQEAQTLSPPLSEALSQYFSNQDAPPDATPSPLN